MRVSEVMTTGVLTVAPETGAAEAWDRMQTEGVHHLVVVRHGEIVGVVSDRDIAPRRRRPARADGTTVATVMNPRVATVGRDETLKRAASVMEGRSIGCLPVLDGQTLVGIVTTADLLRLLGQGVDRPNHEARAALRHRVPHKKQHQATGRW